MSVPHLSLLIESDLSCVLILLAPILMDLNIKTGSLALPKVPAVNDRIIFDEYFVQFKK